MRSDGGAGRPAWGRTAVWLVGLAGLLGIAIGERSLPEMMRSEREVRRLAAEVEKVRDQNLLLGRQIGWAGDTTAFVERLAREELDMVGQDEVVFVVPEGELAVLGEGFGTDAGGLVVERAGDNGRCRSP